MSNALLLGLIWSGLWMAYLYVIMKYFPWEMLHDYPEDVFFSGNTEYDYDIDATTGAIRARDFDCEFYAPTAVNTTNTAKAVTGITQDQALEIALKHAGLSKSEISYVQVTQDFDDGMQQIDVKFYVGMTEYNYDIDANTGTIVDFDAEIDD